MAKGTLFVFCLILISAGTAVSQRAVTNADLEKYRQQRLTNERHYRENYARLGLPSPEELIAREKQSRAEAEELSAKLRAERLERERIEAFREAEMNRAAAFNRQAQAYQGGYYTDPGYYGGYGSYYGGGYGGYGGFGGRFGRHRVNPYGGFGTLQTGYYAGGQFWPTPLSIQAPRRLFVPIRRGGVGSGHGGFGGGHGGGHRGGGGGGVRMIR